MKHHKIKRRIDGHKSGLSSNIWIMMMIHQRSSYLVFDSIFLIWIMRLSSGKIPETVPPYKVLSSIVVVKFFELRNKSIFRLSLSVNTTWNWLVYYWSFERKYFGLKMINQKLWFIADSPFATTVPQSSFPLSLSKSKSHQPPNLFWVCSEPITGLISLLNDIELLLNWIVQTHRRHTIINLLNAAHFVSCPNWLPFWRYYNFMSRFRWCAQRK